MAVNRTASTVVIGIDCATDAKKVGLARGRWTEGSLHLEEVCALSSWEAIVTAVEAWCSSATLLALDAPLGWPLRLGAALGSHVAGAAIDGTTNALFRRATDDLVASEVGKRPLDVGADRIARTAHVALRFLGALRQQTAEEIPLAWRPGVVDAIQAIEVYPAATLAVRGWPSGGYKGNKAPAVDKRATLVEALATEATFDADQAEQMYASDHVLDAALCCLAACDFLHAPLLQPTDEALARREGWIWVRRPAEQAV